MKYRVKEIKSKNKHAFVAQYKEGPLTSWANVLDNLGFRMSPFHFSTVDYNNLNNAWVLIEYFKEYIETKKETITIHTENV